MDQNNRYISATYQLYSVADGKKELEEQTSSDQPFRFISGFGIALDALESRLITLAAGEEFDFTLQPSEAFGDRDESAIHALPRETFIVNGKFDGEHVFPGAIIRLFDEQQTPFMARVLKVEQDEVTLDANHPLAGKVLNFTGKVIENREATEGEIQQLIRQLTGGCHCGEGGCGEGGCGEGGCHCEGKCEK